MLRGARYLLMGLGALALIAGALVGTTEILQARREAQGVAAPATGARVKAGDADIFLQRLGAPERPAVVIVPGTAAWSGFWASAAQRLAREGFYVIAADLPPFGFSSRPEGGYGRAAQAERLAGLLDGLKLQKPLLLAHSFGAGAAVELAMRHPGKLGGLMLVDGALGLAPEGEAPADPVWLRELLGAPLVARALVDAVLVNPWLTRRLLAGLLARPEAASEAAVAVLQTPLAREGTSAAYAQWLPSLLLPETEAMSACPDAYRALALPVALIWGAEDRVTPLAQGERLRALIPGATLDVLPGLGHIPHLEDEGAFTAAAARRLREMARVNGL